MQDSANSEGTPRPPAPVFEPDQLQWGRLSDWAELVRLPNVFTVLSDTLAAAVLVAGVNLPWLTLTLTVIASVLVYWGGMILNDCVDLEEDRLTRLHRPLVRGSISPVVAGHVGTGMLLTAPIIVLLATNLYRQQAMWMGAAFLAAVALSLCVRVYDSAIKRTPIAPVLMGLCRSLNILMVGLVMLAVNPVELGLPRSLLILSAGIGLYIVGITVFARREEGQSQATGLMLGLLLEFGGLALIALLPWLSGEPNERWLLDPWRAFPLLVGLIGLTVINRGVLAINHPVPRKVQLAVKHAILTIVLLDAAVAAASAGPWFGGGIALLLLPAMLIGSKFRST
ncbi:MAG: UbiA family prenyltransferase [Pirellulaceae bacterium]|nr:UbiA family prenyltransferase [Pirellulaceae bacterium]